MRISNEKLNGNCDSRTLSFFYLRSEDELTCFDGFLLFFLIDIFELGYGIKTRWRKRASKDPHNFQQVISIIFQIASLYRILCRSPFDGL